MAMLIAQVNTNLEYGCFELSGSIWFLSIEFYAVPTTTELYAQGPGFDNFLKISHMAQDSQI